MIKTYIVEPGQRPTPEQLQEVEEAKNYPIEFDDDCRELSPAMIQAFRTAANHRNRKKA